MNSNLEMNQKLVLSLIISVYLGKLELVGYYGLNWKSLSQPAILPSSTDFLVPLSELKDEGKNKYTKNQITKLHYHTD